ncbi:hypothetical protein M569_03778, partial [Genlisea aurea]
SSMHEHKREIAGTQDVQRIFLDSTPLKSEGTPRIEDEEKSEKLPEKFDGIMEIFRRMITSVRLLGLRKTTPTFQKISKRVELLTGRKFGFMHLAQIKYMLPEAVQIEKILVHDVRTMCMKPDMKVQLIFDLVQDHDEASEFLALSKLFKSRLCRFYRGNPEACDIPEAALPDPFNAKTITVTEKFSSDDLPETSNSASRRRARIRRTSSLDVTEKTDLHVAVNSSTSVAGASNEVESKTPVKPHSTHGSIHVETPAQSTPMRTLSPTRSVLTCEDECKKVVAGSSSKCLPAATNAKKSLDFNATDESDSDSDFLSRKGKPLLRCSDVVSMIHRAFRSVDFRPMTKEELVFKIVAGNLESTDRGHVEVCMEKIEKLVPNWFWKE